MLYHMLNAQLFLHLRSYVTNNMVWQPSTHGNKELVTHSHQWQYIEGNNNLKLCHMNTFYR